MALPTPLPELSPLQALAWVTALSRAFVLPILGSALLLSAAPGLPRRARAVGPRLVRASLVLLVLAAYGPLASELAGWGPQGSPMYRAASLVVLVCALALVIVLPMLAESLTAGRPAEAAARPGPRVTVLPPPPPAPSPVPRPPLARGATPPPARVDRAASAAATLAPRAAEGPASPPSPPGRRLTFREGPTTPAAGPARPRPEGALPIIPADLVALPRTAAAGPLGSAEAATRVATTPPRIPPIGPDETVRVPSLRPRPSESLLPTRPMGPSTQARLLAASAVPTSRPLALAPRGARRRR